MPFRHKLFAWVLLAGWSVFFGEVSVGSSTFPFWDAWGLLAVVPLYGLHFLVFGALIFRSGAPRWGTILSAGMLFGLYEAYITKVIWQPPWDSLLRLGGIAVPELAISFFWHTIMSFTIPLVVSELLLTRSRAIFTALPRKISAFITTHPRRATLGAGLIIGVSASGITPALPIVLLSLASNFLFLVLLSLLWRHFVGPDRYEFRDLLPSGRSFWVLSFLLVVLYIILGITIRIEILPRTPGPHLIVLALYAMSLWLFLRNVRTPLPNTAPAPAFALDRSSVLLFITGLLFAPPIVFLALPGGSRVVIVIMIWLVCLIGTLAVIRTAAREALTPAA